MSRLSYLLSAIVLTLVCSGCGFMDRSVSEQASFYSLDAVHHELATLREPEATASRRPTLIVNPTHAAAGYDSQRILYVRMPHQLEYYAHSEWIDTPARMLTPLIVAAIERSGGYQAVVLTPSAAVGELRLDTEIVRLQHEYDNQPGRVRFTLRAYIVDTKSRQVLGWREFDEVVDVQNADPYGVVVASNQAVRAVLEKLTIFAKEEAAHWTKNYRD
jgi:cholesterol transport system auxiliary component